MDVFVGVDIGGSHITLGIIGFSDPTTPTTTATTATTADLLSSSSTSTPTSTATSTSTQLLSSSSVPISHTLSPTTLVEILTTLYTHTIKEGWICRSVGVGCPGQIKNGYIVAASNLPNFVNFNLASALEATEVFRGVPVLVLNDADAAVCAEVWGHPALYR
jgi:predicted NBD/HSP70 family sugar kinase